MILNLLVLTCRMQQIYNLLNMLPFKRKRTYNQN